MAVASDDPAEVARGFEALVRAYWRPVYAHVRLRWNRSVEDASDLTQGFFARAFERRQLTSFDPARAKFRTYLKGALDHFVLESDRSDRREKRGGDAMRISLDFDVAESELGLLGPRNDSDIEHCFEKEWTRSLFGAALDALESKCRAEQKQTHLAVFRRYVIDPEVGPASDATTARPSYEGLASELGISVTDVTNRLSWARRTFRDLVLSTLREITATDEEYVAEARTLGIEP